MSKYYYEVAWSYYEEYDPKIFFSEKKLSEEEFNTLVRKLSDESALELIPEEKDSWLGNSEIVPRLWKKLLEHEFFEVVCEQSFNMWGTGIPDDENDREVYKDYLSPDVLEKVIQHNKDTHDTLWKDVK